MTRSTSAFDDLITLSAKMPSGRVYSIEFKRAANRGRPRAMGPYRR